MPGHTITPPPPWATRSTRWHQQTAHPHNIIHAVCHLSCTVKTGIHPWRDHLSKVPDAIECEHLPTQVGYDDELQSGWDPDEDDEHVCRWAFLRRFLTVCAEIIWLCKPIVAAAAVRVAGLRRSWRWRCWMWRSWAGMITHGLQLWGLLDVLPNSLKRLWRRLMVEKWTFNSRATALVDIPAVSMPIARSLKTCGIVLCDKTAHFRVDFNCGQPKIHLFNNHAVWSSSWYATPVRCEVGESSSLAFKGTCTKTACFCFHSNMYFQSDILNDLWGILSWNFTDKLWGHLSLTLHLVLLNTHSSTLIIFFSLSLFLFLFSTSLLSTTCPLNLSFLFAAPFNPTFPPVCTL